MDVTSTTSFLFFPWMNRTPGHSDLRFQSVWEVYLHVISLMCNVVELLCVGTYCIVQKRQ